MEYTCFWIEPTTRERRWLRRFSSGTHCPLINDIYSIHQAVVPLPDGEALFDANGYHHLDPPEHHPPHDDPRWPRTCSCGYVFTSDDTFQHFSRLIYVRPDTGSEMTLDDAPPGAMWDAWWYYETTTDGLRLMVKTPAGDWYIDGPEQGGGHWTRTGTPPRITVRPSIGFPDDRGGWRYHAFLTDGVLRDV